MSKTKQSKWVLTPERLAIIRHNAKMCVSETTIARLVDLHPSTFSEKKNDRSKVKNKKTAALSEKIKDALSSGKSDGEAYAISKLWEHIEKGDKTLLKWYIQVKHGWNDNSTLTVETKEKPNKIKLKPVQVEPLKKVS